MIIIYCDFLARKHLVLSPSESIPHLVTDSNRFCSFLSLLLGVCGAKKEGRLWGNTDLMPSRIA